jgi:hypothetical protein
VKTFKIGELPWHNTPTVLLLGEIDIEIKRELFMFWITFMPKRFMGKWLCSQAKAFP